MGNTLIRPKISKKQINFTDKKNRLLYLPFAKRGRYPAQAKHTIQSFKYTITNGEHFYKSQIECLLPILVSFEGDFSNLPADWQTNKENLTAKVIWIQLWNYKNA
jgi:hypothetical protein